MMKTFILSILLCLFLIDNAFTQYTINQPLVQFTNITNSATASTEFYNYHISISSSNRFITNKSDIENYIGLSLVTSDPLLVYDTWNNLGSKVRTGFYIKWLARLVESYAIMYQYETNGYYKYLYKTYAENGANLLLLLFNHPSLGNGDGGLPECTNSSQNNCNPTEMGVFATSAAASALYECYIAFNDIKYKNQVITTTEWLYNNSAYPYNSFLFGNKYYSNVNHLGLVLKATTNAYKLTSSKVFLDRAIQIAEEIIYWQNHSIGSNDIWIGSTDGTNDGTWYWYDYSNVGGTIAPTKKIDYHCSTMDGLTYLLDAINQTTHEGTVTIRNNQNFTDFIEELVLSIVDASNYILTNQETIDSSNGYKGLIRSNKDELYYNIDTKVIEFDGSSSPYGISSLIRAYDCLKKIDDIDNQSIYNIESTIYSIVEEYLVHINSLNWAEHNIRITRMLSLADYYKFLIASKSRDYTLNNSSFENNNVEWELWSWDNINPTVSNEYSYLGDKSVHIFDDNSDASKWALTKIDAKPLHQYTASAYVYVKNNRQSIYLKFFDSNNNLLSTQRTVKFQNTGFEYISISGIAPSNTSYCTVTLYSDWFRLTEGYWDNIDFIDNGVTIPKVRNSIVDSNVDFNSYPNPFNPMSNIEFKVDNYSHVKINVYNMTGELVANIANDFYSTGSHVVVFDAGNLPSGIYIVKANIGNNLITKKITLIK